VTSRAAPTNVISNYLPFCYCIALKKDRNALLILRHHCRLPPSSASLIQEIGEGIFVVSSMPRQLDHHSLVFFHRGLEIMSR
jgi:hypothetical protein